MVSQNAADTLGVSNASTAVATSPEDIAEAADRESRTIDALHGPVGFLVQSHFPG
jgi:hypothetical protein